MSFSKRIYKWLGVVVLLWSSLATAISDEMRDLVIYETEANAIAKRSSEKQLLYHYEIPLRTLEMDARSSSDSAYLDAMTFEKNGEKYVRWVLNPEDTRWEKAIRTHMLRHGIEPELKSHFEGYKTASRSYIVVDPETKAEFSLKTSTNRTGGFWADKKQTWDDARQIRAISDYVIERLSKQPALMHGIVLHEPLAFGIPKYDMGMIIRSYEGLSGSGKRYVPGFSILHEQLGVQLAQINGSNDPATYWNENYNKPLARALAEFFVATGIRYDSPHSQNFLVEIDRNNRPTGKIVLRDFGDSFLYEQFFESVKRKDIIDMWEQKNVRRVEPTFTIGTLHGNRPPSWIDFVNDYADAKSYDQWGRDFFKEFESEVKKQTGFEMFELAEMKRSKTKDVMGIVRKAGYFRKDYMFFSWEGLLGMIGKDQLREHGALMHCSRLFMY